LQFLVYYAFERIAASSRVPSLARRTTGCTWL